MEINPSRLAAKLWEKFSKTDTRNKPATPQSVEMSELFDDIEAINQARKPVVKS